jgi:hypothetical protein
MKPSEGFQFALPEQKRVGQTGFLGVCAAHCLHIYHAPDNGRAAQVNQFDSWIPSKIRRACNLLSCQESSFSVANDWEKDTMTTTNNNPPAGSHYARGSDGVSGQQLGAICC